MAAEFAFAILICGMTEKNAKIVFNKLEIFLNST
jgi:hypothetical protein